MSRPARAGFSLFEVLAVLAVISVLVGASLAVPARFERDAEVRAAAEELAAVLRATRAMAMEKRAMYAVCFNVANSPGSSGRLLDNRSGGHWYRVLGPTANEIDSGWWYLGNGFPPLYDRERSSLNGADTQNHPTTDSPVRHQLQAVERAWVGDRRALPAGKVRFLALTDEDNGNYRKDGDTYPPTYPRPWFGWWDAASGRLYPWGGYDPDLGLTAQTGLYPSKHPPRTRNGHLISHSGFFYEGYDGPIAGSVNPRDRLIIDDTNDDGVISSNGSDDFTKRWPLMRAGEPRPLINAAWQDFMIVFRPDGTVFTDWMRLRHECAKAYDPWLNANLFIDPSLDTSNGDAVPPPGKQHMMDLGPGDMCNRVDQWADGYPWVMNTTGREGSTFASRDGFHFVTLAADSARDDDHFADAGAALRSLYPMYRVGVSAFGEVKVVRVSMSETSGRQLDTALSGPDWNDKTKTDRYYRYHLLVNPTGAAAGTPASRDPRGEPVTDVVNADMLAKRLWWWK